MRSSPALAFRMGPPNRRRRSEGEDLGRSLHRVECRWDISALGVKPKRLKRRGQVCRAGRESADGSPTGSRHGNFPSPGNGGGPLDGWSPYAKPYAPGATGRPGRSCAGPPPGRTEPRRAGRVGVAGAFSPACAGRPDGGGRVGGRRGERPNRSRSASTLSRAGCPTGFAEGACLAEPRTTAVSMTFRRRLSVTRSSSV